MADVFISYSRANERTAIDLEAALERFRLTVFRDRQMGNVDWSPTIEREIDAARAVVVIWSSDAIGSAEVLKEARLADKKLVSIHIDEPSRSIPDAYRQGNAIDFRGWSGSQRHSTSLGSLLQWILSKGVATPEQQINDDRRRLQEYALALENVLAHTELGSGLTLEDGYCAVRLRPLTEHDRRPPKSPFRLPAICTISHLVDGRTGIASAILGGRNRGKSIALRHTALACAGDFTNAISTDRASEPRRLEVAGWPDGGALPLLVDAAVLTGRSLDKGDLIEAALAPVRNRLNTEQSEGVRIAIDNHLTNRRPTLVLLDNVDRLGSDAAITRVLDALGAALPSGKGESTSGSPAADTTATTQWSGTRAVLAARSRNATGDIEKRFPYAKFTRFELLDLDTGQQDSLLAKIKLGGEGEVTKNLQESSRFRSAHFILNVLPLTRREGPSWAVDPFYHDLTEVLSETEEFSAIEGLRELLAATALRTFAAGREYFSRSDLVRLMDPVWPDCRAAWPELGSLSLGAALAICARSHVFRPQEIDRGRRSPIQGLAFTDPNEHRQLAAEALAFPVGESGPDAVVAPQRQEFADPFERMEALHSELRAHHDAASTRRRWLPVLSRALQMLDPETARFVATRAVAQPSDLCPLPYRLRVLLDAIADGLPVPVEIAATIVEQAIGTLDEAALTRADRSQLFEPLIERTRQSATIADGRSLAICALPFTERIGLPASEVGYRRPIIESGLNWVGTQTQRYLELQMTMKEDRSPVAAAAAAVSVLDLAFQEVLTANEEEETRLQPLTAELIGMAGRGGFEASAAAWALQWLTDALGCGEPVVRLRQENLEEMTYLLQARRTGTRMISTPPMHDRVLDRIALSLAKMQLAVEDPDTLLMRWAKRADEICANPPDGTITTKTEAIADDPDSVARRQQSMTAIRLRSGAVVSPRCAIALARLGARDGDLAEPLAAAALDPTLSVETREEAICRLAAIEGSAADDALVALLRRPPADVSGEVLPTLALTSLLALSSRERTETARRALDVLPPLEGGEDEQDAGRLRRLRQRDRRLLSRIAAEPADPNGTTRKEPRVGEPSTFLERFVSHRGHRVHKLKAKDSTGRWAYYFVLVVPRHERSFMRAIGGDGMIDLLNWGHVLASNYGDGPSDHSRRSLMDRFRLKV